MAAKRDPGFWTPANIITVARVVMIPVVMVFLFDPAPTAGWIAMAIFVVAGVSDLIDGYLARLYGQVSVIGAFLDPLADKLMVMAVMVMLIPLGRIPAWLVVLLLARELVITGLRGIASAEGIIISASSGGKFKTAYQMTGLSFLLIHYRYLEIECHTVGLWLMYISSAISLWSGWMYCWEFAKISRLRKVGEGAG
ncbi:MAG TPA: CDP-diacylglycerol--glycerol-3-phosphate 3-phosphatidyltransferase [bacterium]|nr:CDP-diacylglycerol--glycerol-3-phosphate 3-phosphatidyltransferase [bacterium]